MDGQDKVSFASAWQRREHIGSLLGKTVVGDSDGGIYMHSNAQNVHPIDALAKAIEDDGIRHLLGLLKKKELLKLVQCVDLQIDSTSKRSVKKALQLKVIALTAKKFLKHSVPDEQLAMIAERLMIAPGLDRKELVEAILRQLTIVGMETFSKKVPDKEVKDKLRETAESHRSGPEQNPTETKGKSSAPSTSNSDKSPPVKPLKLPSADKEIDGEEDLRRQCKYGRKEAINSTATTSTPKSPVKVPSTKSPRDKDLPGKQKESRKEKRENSNSANSLPKKSHSPKDREDYS